MKSKLAKFGVLLLAVTLSGAALAQSSGAQRMGNGSNGTSPNNGVSDNAAGAFLQGPVGTSYDAYYGWALQPNSYYPGAPSYGYAPQGGNSGGANFPHSGT
jgi:hypothetical protein